MGLFSLVGSYAAAKAKDIVSDIWNELDLDKNGVKDKEQIHKWCDTLGSAGAKLDEAIDQEKVMVVVKDVAGTVKEIAAYIEGVKEHSQDEQPKKK